MLKEIYTRARPADDKEPADIRRNILRSRELDKQRNRDAVRRAAALLERGGGEGGEREPGSTTTGLSPELRDGIKPSARSQPLARNVW